MAFNDTTTALTFERSGSCAIVVIIIEDACYVANLGDSRALLSEDSSTNVRVLSRDHRPDDEAEKNRIQRAGGSVYITKYHDLNTNKEESGPVRILPGKLSVSRSFGDVHAKNQRLGGNDKVLIAVPEVRSFKLKESTDFIAIGCDGIFEKLSNTDLVHSVWSMAKELSIGPDIHDHCGRCVDIILKNCLQLNANDNITLIFIAFKNFKRTLFNLKFDNSEKRFKHFEKIKARISENMSEDSFRLIEDPEEDKKTPVEESIPSTNTNSFNNIFSGLYSQRSGGTSSLPLINKLSKK
jgi:serine/threonine protein phosphatase PrpC